MHKWIIEIADFTEPISRYAVIHNFEDAGFVVAGKRLWRGHTNAVRWRYTLRHTSKHAMMLRMLTDDAKFFYCVTGVY